MRKVHILKHEKGNIRGQNPHLKREAYMLLIRLGCMFSNRLIYKQFPLGGKDIIH